MKASNSSDTRPKPPKVAGPESDRARPTPKAGVIFKDWASI